jgi:PAS domain S-box-containing protein
MVDQPLAPALQTEERLKYLLSTSPAILYSCAATGDYGATFISDNVTAQLGYPPVVFTQDSSFWASRIHAVDRTQVFIELGHLFECGHHTHEYRFRHQDGTYRWVRDDLRLIRNQAGEPLEIVGSWLDITRERQFAQAHRQTATNLQQQVEWQRLVMAMTQNIRRSLNLEDVLTTTVHEVRQFLHTDRVVIFQFNPTWDGTVVTESVGAAWLPLLGRTIADPCFADHHVTAFQQGQVTAKANIQTAGISACHLDLLTRFQVIANLVVPILQGETLWGLLIAHHCAAPREWQPLEIDLLRQLASQVGLAIQQADLFAQVQIELADRRQTADALRQSEERWQLAIAGSNDGIWDYDLITQTSFQSEHCTAIMGHAVGTINNVAEWLQFIHPEDVEAVMQAWSSHLQGKTPFYMVEYRLRHADGTYHWVMSRGQAIWNDQGQPIRIAGSMSDISDRKQAEAEIRALNADLEQRVLERTAELRHSMAEISDLYTNAPCGYHSLDGSGTFTRINNTALSWLGYSRGEILHQKKFSDLLTPASLAIFQTNFTQFKTQGWVNNLEFDMVRKDGSILPVSLNSTAIFDQAGGYVMSRSTVFDISQRKQVENSLREAERRWRSLLEHVRLVVIGLDHTGRVEFANPFFLELTGYSLDEVLGRDWFTTFLPATAQPTVQMVFHELIEQDFHPHYENAIVTKAGEARTIAWNNTLLRDTQGKVIGTMSIGEDITHRQAVERLKDEFISIVSHELRTPLTSIRGSLGLLATGILDDSPAEMRRMIEIAALDTERLVRLVNDILDLERLESGKIGLVKALCDPAVIMQRSLAVMQPSADAVQVTLDMAAPSLGTMSADSDRLMQTFTNLLSNAIKFSSPGGIVWLTAERITAHSAHPSQANQASLVAPFLLFQIKDEGRGIPANKLETIFGRFQQVDASDSRVKGGTGLGLAICQTIVQQHGGDIWVESRLGVGSTFSFTVPIAPEVE